MYFEIIGDITHVGTFAAGSAIRELGRLRKRYGRGRWRKRKGIARFACKTAQSSGPRYTGTRLTASGAEASR